MTLSGSETVLAAVADDTVFDFSIVGDCPDSILVPAWVSRLDDIPSVGRSISCEKATVWVNKTCPYCEH